MTKLREIKSPIALAAFGAFFVPEPLGMCVVLASAIWWLTGISAVAQETSSERDRRMMTRQYAALFALGTCFLIGLWLTVRLPSHRLQNQTAYSDTASDQRQDSARTDVPPPPAPK